MSQTRKKWFSNIADLLNFEYTVAETEWGTGYWGYVGRKRDKAAADVDRVHSGVAYHWSEELDADDSDELDAVDSEELDADDFDAADLDYFFP